MSSVSEIFSPQDLMTLAFFALGHNVPINPFKLKMDIYHTNSHVIVKVDLPGMKKDDISIAVKSDNVLTISGTRRNEDSGILEEKSNEKVKSRYISEISYGKFSRSILLPKEAGLNAVKSSFTDGVLTIKFDKIKKSVNIINID